jgi:transcription initiation factor TFIID subunit 15
MKLAFILVLVLSSVSATSVFAGRNRQGANQGNVFAAAGGANKNAGGANNTAAGANNTAAGANNTANAGGNAGGDPQTSTTLDPSVISKNFAQDGQNPPVAGQTASETSTNNFINFCLTTLKQFPLTDGQQLKGGSCNNAPMGLLPSADKMVSTILIFPQNGDVVEANKDFTISVLSTNIKLGVFTNAQQTYLAAPQTLDPSTNEIIGHTHVTVQPITSTTTPPDPTKFAFFKGINTAADAQGQVSADVAGGLPPGDYRVCTMTSAANHQPVVMPIAQRGSQDDCVRFKAQVGAASNGTANNAAGGNNAANNTAGGNAANNTAGGNTANNTATAGGNAANNTATAGGNNAANNTTTTANTAGGNNPANNPAGGNKNGAAGGQRGANGNGGGGRGRKGKRWLNREFI